MYEKCKEILLQEYELIQMASYVQENIRLAVFNKEWTVFEDQLSSMSSIEAKLGRLECEREKLFTVFEAIVHEKNFCENLDAKGRFYKMVSVLPDDQRNDLTSIYRSLKLEALKLRMANDTLMIYLEGVKATLKDFFDFAFPDRGGKMYTNQGTHLSHDMRSMVLNTRF